jgi:hypothetical protein
MRFGYFSARESNARPGEGQTKGYTKAYDKDTRQKTKKLNE